jgi:hypothetical protein
MRVLSVCTIVIAALVAQADPLPAVSGTDVVVSRDDGTLPQRCGVERAGSVIAGFFDAYSRGDSRAAARRWLPRPGRRIDGVPESNPRRFQWYSITEVFGKGSLDRHFAAYKRARLRRHVARRAGFDDVMRLRELLVHFDKARDLVHFELRVERTAADVPAGQPVVDGKGALHCSRLRLTAMSLAHTRAAPPAPLCPARPEGAPPDAAVACTR